MRESQSQDEGGGNRATRDAASVLHDGLEAGALEAFLGSLR
jgi:hypothetical protein